VRLSTQVSADLCALGGNHGGVLANEQNAYKLSQSSKELEDLRELLGRTNHVVPKDIIRCGTHSTLSLRKMNDGQSDDIAMQRSRRLREEQELAEKTGRKGWDGSVWMYTPPALKGCKPITPEPWARDASAYEDGMTHGHGHKRAVVDSRYIKVAPELAKSPPKHASMIENAMCAYRKEVGTSGVVTAREGPSAGALRSERSAGAASSRAWSSSPPPTSANRSARTTTSPVEQAATDRAARIKAKSQAASPDASPPKGKLQAKAAKISPNSVIG